MRNAERVELSEPILKPYKFVYSRGISEFEYFSLIWAQDIAEAAALAMVIYEDDENIEVVSVKLTKEVKIND